MAEKLEVIITATDKASGVLSSIGKLGGGILKAGLLGAGAAVAGLAAGLGYAVNEAMEAQEVVSQLDAVLKSTGGAAGVTRDMATGLADSLGKVTRFSDEAVLSGENMLLTFTNIGKDIFPDATTAMLDMSQALGQDIKSSAIQLGKALNDPVQGITALQRVGVSFTDEQKKMVEGMVAAGDVMGAQKFILAELQKEFGGSAEAAGQTFAGQLDILKNSLANVAEGVGTAVLPILQSLMDTVIIPIVPYIQAFAEGVKILFDEFSRGAEQGGLLGGVMEVLDNFLSEEMIATIWNTIDAVKAWIDEGLAVLIPWLQDAIPAALAFLQETIGSFVAAVGAWWQEHGAAITAQAQETWAAVSQAIQDFIAFITPVIQFFLKAISDFWKEHGDEIMAFIGDFLAWILTNFGAYLQNVANAVSETLAAIKAFWDAHGEQITAVVQALWDGIKAIWEAFKSAYESAVELFHLAQEGNWYAFGEKLREILDAAWEAIKQVFTDAWEAIKTIVGNGIEAIKEKFTNTDWKEVGKNIIRGVADGITASLQWLKDAAIKAAKAAYDAAKGFLGIESPSKLFADIGKNMMSGMASGIVINAKMPIAASLAASTGTAQAAIAGSSSISIYGGLHLTGVQRPDDLLSALSEYMV